jgi:hypothetical protein
MSASVGNDVSHRLNMRVLAYDPLLSADQIKSPRRGEG